MTDLSLFATVPRGLESLLAGELRGLGAAHVKQVRAGVAFSGSLETAYRTCLWSRLAGRVLLPVTSGKAADGDELYKTALAVDWSRHLDVDATLAVDFTGANERIRDTRFGAVRIKDAIVDQFRATSAQATVRRRTRARRARERAPCRHTRGHLHRSQRTEPASARLPRRQGAGRGAAQGEPGRRTAAVRGLAERGSPPARSLLDPLCGSGTLPIEAALMAADVAPGLLRAEAEAKPGSAPAFGFLQLERPRRRALGRAPRGGARAPRGRDQTARGGPAGRHHPRLDRDQRAVKVARDFVKRAGLHGLVTIDHAQLETVEAPAERGLLATNAPYGERLEAADTETVYRQLGERLREAFPRWSAVVLAGDQRQLKAMGVAPKRETDLRNGPLECVLAYYKPGAAPTGAAAPRTARAEVRSSSRRTPTPDAETAAASPPVRRASRRPAGNRASDSRRPAQGARRTAPSTSPTGCARTSAAWRDGCSARASPATASTTPTCPSTTSSSTCTAEWVHVQEYAAPPEIDRDKAKRRLDEAVEVIGAVLETPPERVVLKERRRQRGAAQYERRPQRGDLLRRRRRRPRLPRRPGHLSGHRLLHRPAARRAGWSAASPAAAAS